MSKAMKLIEKINRISEIGYYGQHDYYGTEQYDNDAAEYMKPFGDVQLPDKSGTPRPEQTKNHKRKSKIEDGKGNVNQ